MITLNDYTTCTIQIVHVNSYLIAKYINNQITKARTKTMATLKQIRQELENRKGRSAWTRGVIEYAWELFDNIEQRENWLGLNDEQNYRAAALDDIMLNGASNWKEYSWAGCSLIYDADIAKQLCSPSELKRKDNGRLQPNTREQWLDVQARALRQAAHLIKSIAWSIDLRKGVQE